MKDTTAIAHELAALLGRIVRDNCDVDERANALDALRETMDEAAGCSADYSASTVKHYPEAEAVLQETDQCYLWIVPDCPLCGGKHTHGGGALSNDPRELLGHRVAHCAVVGGYVLVETMDASASTVQAPVKRTASILEARFKHEARTRKAWEIV